MTTNDKIHAGGIATRIVHAFRRLDAFEQHLALELYRLLAVGQPVPRELLAERLHVSVGRVNGSLNTWPGVYSNHERRIVGFWGLSLPSAYASPHQLVIEGEKLSAWCAWDTLFLPHLLGKTAEVESTSPIGGNTVTLKVTPERVAHVDPNDACMSFLLPDVTAFQKDVIGSFCHFVHFFPSRQEGESWIEEHKGTILLSIDEGLFVAQRKNELQFAAKFSVLGA